MFSSAIACARISSAPGHAIASVELLLALVAMLITATVFLRYQRGQPIPTARTLYGLAGLYITLAIATPVAILSAQGYGVLVGEVCSPAGLVTVAIAIALCIAVPLLLAQVMTTAARADMAASAMKTMPPPSREVIPLTVPTQRTARQEARAETCTDDWLNARRVLQVRGRSGS